MTLFDRTREAPSPRLIGDLRRMALAAPSPAHEAMPRRAALKAVAALVVAPAASSLLRGGGMAPHAAVADAPDPIGQASAKLLSRPITLTWRGGRFDLAIRYLAERLRPADGERLELLPSQGQDDAKVLVDIACVQQPLRAVLDLACRGTGWRWRAAGSTILVDHLATQADHSRALGALTEQTTAANVQAAYDATYELATSGNADCCMSALRALGDARVDAWAARDPAMAVAYQSALLHGLAALSTDLLPRTATSAWHRMLVARPYAALAALDDGRGAQAIARTWSRCPGRIACRSPRSSATSRANSTCVAAEADLLAITARPGDRSSTSWIPARPVEAAALERMRQVAIWSLGELGTAAAITPIEAMLRRDPAGPSSDACVSALARLGDAGLTPILQTRRQPVAEVSQGCEYCALARLDRAGPAGAAARRGPPIPDGWWDAFTTHPVAALLPRMLDSDGRFALAPSRVREAFRQGCLRLGAAALPALRHRLDQPQDEIMRDWCRLMLTMLGDAAACGDVQRLVQTRIDQPPWSWGTWAIVPALPNMQVQALARQLDANATLTETTPIRLAWMATARRARPSPSRAITSISTLGCPEARAAVLGFLAQAGSPAARWDSCARSWERRGADRGRRGHAAHLAGSKLVGVVLRRCRRCPAPTLSPRHAMCCCGADCGALYLPGLAQWRGDQDAVPAMVANADASLPRQPAGPNALAISACMRAHTKWLRGSADREVRRAAMGWLMSYGAQATTSDKIDIIDALMEARRASPGDAFGVEAGERCAHSSPD